LFVPISFSHHQFHLLQSSQGMRPRRPVPLVRVS
jgi:hypothetical protein